MGYAAEEANLRLYWPPHRPSIMHKRRVLFGTALPFMGESAFAAHMHSLDKVRYSYHTQDRLLRRDKTCPVPSSS